MTRPPGGSTGSDAAWDISFLRPGLLVTGSVAAVAAALMAVLGGWGSAVAVLTGAAVVAGFFCVSAVVIAWAGRIDDSLALPAAMGTFLVKALLLFLVLGRLPEDGWLDRLTFAWTVIAAALLWSAVQARWVWTRQLYYAPPPTAPADPSARPAPDPEGPASRG